MNSNSSSSTSTSNRPPFHISRASDEITQFPSYETMHQLSTSPNHKSHHSTSNPLFIGAIDFFTSLVPGLSSPRSNNHHHHHQPNPILYNSDQEEGRPDGLNSDRIHQTDQDTDEQTLESKLSKIKLLTLTFNLLSCNLVWTILIYYGMPFILKLDLSSNSKTLLWLASPISGLIIPPILGMISDLNYKSLHRRRTWIVISTLILLISLISLSFCQPLGLMLTYIIGSDQGDWDPERLIHIQSNSIFIAILSFYFSFFSLDSLFLFTRSLILDQISANHQNLINVWSSRMSHLGNLMGFGIASLSNSNHGPHEPQLLRDLIGYSLLLLICTSTLICLTQVEHPPISLKSSRPSSESLKIKLNQFFRFYKTFLNTLPIPIKRVCYVQIFNSVCWITILYHSKSLISKFVLHEETLSGIKLTESLIRYSERQGTITMFKFSLLSLIFSFVLPFLCDFGTTEFVINQRGQRWIMYRRMLRFLTPRNLWSFSFLVYVILMGFTFVIESSMGASRLIILLGFSWSISQWVPFALLMEYTRSIEETPPINQFIQTPISSPSTRRVSNTPPTQTNNISQKIENRRPNERTHLIDSPSDEIPLNLIKSNHPISTKTGASILAVHQLSTVAPHFLISILTSMMFNIVYLITQPSEEPINLKDSNLIIIEKPSKVLWFFRFTFIFGLLGLGFSRKIILPTSELEYWDELNYQIYETQRFRNGEVLQEDDD
ncbi:hypothetical protein DFH28DRAFT_1050696 [Melampsora americana]|nr:hypothetical protein DFH28DRAFT_1050696 [Melampsora americana]